MKLKILAVVLVGIFVSGVCLAAEPVKVIPPAQSTLSTPGGRFVLGQISDYHSDQFLLDTATGRVWRVVEYTPSDDQGNPIPGASKRTALQSMQFLDREGSTSDLPFDPKQDRLNKEFGAWLKTQPSKK